MFIYTVVGARPQFIKAAIVSQVFQVTTDIQESIIHTGQHYDDNMSAIFFQELEITRPDYHLDIGSGTHGLQTGRMLEAIEQVFLEKKPDWVLVYGDTNSTLAGALAAVKLHIRVAHVEAGLRSFHRQMPEEINRVLTDHVSSLLFAPTNAAVENLRQEGIPEERIYLAGDVMYDAALYYGKKAECKSHILKQLGLSPKDYILATVHRAENTDEPLNLKAIFTGLNNLACEIPVVMPLHPRTRAALIREELFEKTSRSLLLIDPVGYLDMVMLEKNACLIATDSGGVQKEAFFYRVPCVTLREQTEWIETVEVGANLLAGAQTDRLVEAAKQQLQRDVPLPDPGPYYGNGKAAQRIASLLMESQVTL